MTDVLSDVLVHLDLRGLRCTRLEAAGAWSLRFGLRSLLKFVAVLKGAAWLIPDGETPIRLNAGDTFLLAGATDYVVASDPGLEPRDGLSAFDWEACPVARYGGDDTIMLGGALDVNGAAAGFLLEAVPKVVLIPATDRSAEVLRLLLTLMDGELRGAGKGSEAAVRRLAELLLVHALRIYAERKGTGRAAWLTGLAEPRVGRAMGLMHGDPARPWTIAELAKGVGMSRSAFAALFARKAGLPPLSYLTRWRMERARSGLRAGARPMAEIAREAGYGSEAAFGLAFKRQYGIPPGRFRKRS